MNLALIPFYDRQLNDKYFFSIDENGNKVWTEDHLRAYWDWVYDHGHVIHTIDVYDSYDDIDFILLYQLDWRWIRKLTNAGQNNKIIYCNSEPPTVIAENCPEGHKKLKKMFPYILSWNSEWVDNEWVFKKPIGYVFRENYSEIPFADRKLATAITAYKTSTYKDELYSERERAYTYFETHYPDEFEFYGFGWNSQKHPGYKGTVKDKKTIYHNYKFSICLENTKNVADYVTEKIMDCLCSGIVPVYGGAKNITEHVPANCFIDYFSFASFDDMAKYLTEMDEATYNEYLANAKEFITNIDREPYRHYQIAASAVNAANHPHTISVSLGTKIYVNLMGIKVESILWIKRKLGLIE